MQTTEFPTFDPRDPANYTLDEQVGGLLIDKRFIRMDVAEIETAEGVDADGIPTDEQLRALAESESGRETIRAWGNESDFAAVGWDPSESPYLDGIGARDAK